MPKNAGKITAVIVISNLEYGGAQRQVVELANNIDTDGLDLHICSLSDYVPLGALLDDRTALHVIQKRFKFDASVVPRLAALLRKLGADIVHGFLFDAEIAARLAGRMAGVRAVGNSERNTDYELKPLQLAAYRLTRRCVDFCVANSNAGAEFNQRVLGNPKEQYYTVHNGVDTARFRPRSGTDVRKTLGLASGDFVIGMFGSFKTQKNHPLLFEAARPVIDRNPGTKLLLVGDELAGGLHGSDQYKVRTMDLIRQLDLEQHCVFAGNRNDVEALYPACDVTVLPSLFEGTPNAVLESMACAVPVVATNVSDNAYIVRDGETGYLVPPAAAAALAGRLLTLAEDDMLRASMGARAREWVEREFSCTRLASKTTAVYRDVLGYPAPEAAALHSFELRTGRTSAIP
jgi:glycosyltransferase involved in cell wall biosynthesis